MLHRVLAVIAALIILGVDAPQIAQGARAIVIVHNRARIPDDLISDAKDIVNRIYVRAGLELVWFVASRTLTIASDNTKISIIILPKQDAAAIPHPFDAVGFTPGSRRGRGRLAYILAHRVTAVSQGYSARPSTVLGAAIAHEIGHMFLSRSHMPTGLMRGQFNQSDFRRIAAGEVRFTEHEAAEMRAHFLPADVRASMSTFKR